MKPYGSYASKGQKRYSWDDKILAKYKRIYNKATRELLKRTLKKEQ